MGGPHQTFSTDLRKKSKSVETIYIYASESSHYIFSENAMTYRGLSQKKYADLAEIPQKFFDFKHSHHSNSKL